MSPRLRLLIAEDNEDDALLVVRAIRKAGYQVDFQRVDTAEDMAAAYDAGGWDAVISDVNMPSFSAGRALALVLERGGDLPFIVVSGVIGEETAVDLLKGGAHDFILKTNLARLVPALERERREHLARRQRRAAEAALRVSEERYALAARGSNDGLWDWDLRSGAVYYSPRWRSIIGGDIGDQPEDWFGLINPQDRAAVERAIADHLAGRSEHLAVEHRLRHQSGSWRWVLARGLAVRDESGRPCRIAGSLSDITARKAGEQELRAAKEELENALAAKTRFLAAASHDLRQPFQSMRLYQHMLAEAVSEPLHKKIVNNLGEAMTAGESLLHALLDVSTLDAGIIPVNPEVVQPLDLAAGILREVEQEAAGRGITLKARGCGEIIHTDPTLLGRILRNLVSNALRYTPSGGRILVACRPLGEVMRIQVWDTGIGIAPEMQAAVFEDFVQVGNAERDRRQGLGLGLSIVRRMTRLLGCELALRSTPGRGSVFTLSFRRSAPQSHAAVIRLPTAAGHPEPPSPFHILVIEDDEMQLDALRLMLETWGYHITAAVDGRAALAALAAAPGPPDVIISDFRLPGEMNGVETVTRLCAAAGRSIPALIVTGDTAPERIREAAQTGCGLLHKPYDPATLRATVIDMLPYEAAAGKRWGEGGS